MWCIYRTHKVWSLLWIVMIASVSLKHVMNWTKWYENNIILCAYELALIYLFCCMTVEWRRVARSRAAGVCEQTRFAQRHVGGRNHRQTRSALDSQPQMVHPVDVRHVWRRSLRRLGLVEQCSVRCFFNYCFCNFIYFYLRFCFSSRIFSKEKK